MRLIQLNVNLAIIYGISMRYHGNARDWSVQIIALNCLCNYVAVFDRVTAGVPGNGACQCTAELLRRLHHYPHKHQKQQ